MFSLNFLGKNTYFIPRQMIFTYIAVSTDAL
jgi:hypothetical protein